MSRNPEKRGNLEKLIVGPEIWREKVKKVENLEMYTLGPGIS